MDKNKSIDGLVTRRSKNSATTTSKPTKKTTKARQATSIKSQKTSSPRTKTTKKKPTNSPKTTKVKKGITLNPELNEPITPPIEPTNQEASTDFLKPVQAFDFDEQSGELKASSLEPSHVKKSKHKKEKKPISKKRKIITSVLLAIVILLIGGVLWLVIWGNDIIAKITGGQGNLLDLITFVEPTYNPLKTDENGRTNILAFGTSGYNMDGDEGNGTHDGAQLTDSIMVISLNQDTGDVAMLSLPRDLKASPTCTATGKINEVYWCNGGGGEDSIENENKAASALTEEVGNILGIDFQYYAHLNWGSLVQIVNTLNGITVTLDEDVLDYNWTGAVFKAGEEYTINGEQALGLARARHGTTGGDFTRGASQQKILIGIKDRVLEKNLSITELIELSSTLGDNLRTNFSVDELKTLAHLAADLDFNSIRQLSLLKPETLMTTGNINGISYVLPVGGVGNYTRIKAFITKMLSNDPRVYEDASILVLNGTETVGLASVEQKSLEEAGYNNISTDNAPEGDYEETYSLYVLDDTTPGTKKMLEEKYSTTAKSFSELPSGISGDYNFILILGGNTNDTETDN